MMQGLGRMLIIGGLLIAGIGVLLWLGEKLPLRIGRLPGDIVWRGKNTTFYFPLMTSILASAVLSLILWLVSRR